MDYKVTADEWYHRALKEKDEFVKFILLFISLEVIWKLKSNDDLRKIKNDNSIKVKFYDKIDQKFLAELKYELYVNPLKNMKYDRGDKRSVKLNSINDFDGIIEFIIISRNNLFHGDKGLDEKRDLFIVKSGIKILQPLVEVIF